MGPHERTHGIYIRTAQTLARYEEVLEDRTMKLTLPPMIRLKYLPIR